MLLVHEPREHLAGQMQLLEARDRLVHPPDHQGQRAPLPQDVGAEAPDGGPLEGEVHLAVGVEGLPALRAHQLEGRLGHVLGGERLLAGRQQLAVHAQERVVADLQEQVGRFLIRHRLQQPIKVHGPP